MKFTVVVAVFAMIFQSCQSKFSPGVYVSNDKARSVRLTLDTNHRFAFVMDLWLSRKQTQGNWIYDGNNICLMSDAGFTSINGKVKEVTDNISKKYTLEFYDYNCESAEGQTEVLVNDSIRVVSDLKGRVELDYPISSFQVWFPPKYQFYYKCTNRSANKFIVCLIPAHDYEIFFANKKLKFSDNTLVFDSLIKLKRRAGLN